MKRTLTTMAVTSISLLAMSVATSAHSTPQKLQLHNTNLGKILVDRQGFTVFMFTKDKKNKDMCVKISGCSGTWPPLLTSGKPVAGAGVKKSLIGTINIGHGHEQVTYNGHPLYTYAFDGGPGQTFYVGASQFGGRWYALNASGNQVK